MKTTMLRNITIKILFSFFFCSILICSAAIGDEGKSEDRPNIVFIMTDDHAYQALSCYGSKINKTPNLDRIAKEGMRFDNFFCTNSICAPSRAVIITSKYSHLNGVIDNKRPIDFTGQITFPEVMQKAGYATAMIGKWHLKTEPTGFDYWDVLPGQGLYYDPEFIVMGERKKFPGYVTDIITDKSINWIKSLKGDKPFMLMYQHKASHRLWQPDEKHAKLWEDEDIPEPETFNDDYKTRSIAAIDNTMSIERNIDENDIKQAIPENLKGQALKEWKYQRFIKEYLRCVQSLDDNVGRFLDFLDEAGLADNTIVFYTSDQGFYLGEHGWFDKRYMYEISLRSPMLVRWPGKVKAGSVNKDIVLNLDIGPTILDIAGAKIPEDFQGESFKPLLLGKTPDDWRKSMYYHYYEYPGWHMVKRHYGVRTDRYKLIHYYYDIDAWELYDLEKDPNELNNVIAHPDYQDIRAELEAELHRLQKQYKDSDELARKMVKEDVEAIEAGTLRFR